VPAPLCANSDAGVSATTQNNATKNTSIRFTDIELLLVEPVDSPHSPATATPKWLRLTNYLRTV
jgi:hypothetical protein